MRKHLYFLRTYIYVLIIQTAYALKKESQAILNIMSHKSAKNISCNTSNIMAYTAMTVIGSFLSLVMRQIVP